MRRVVCRGDGCVFERVEDRSRGIDFAAGKSAGVMSTAAQSLMALAVGVCGSKREALGQGVEQKSGYLACLSCPAVLR